MALCLAGFELKPAEHRRWLLDRRAVTEWWRIASRRYSRHPLANVLGNLVVHLQINRYQNSIVPAPLIDVNSRVIPTNKLASYLIP
jgi:hypothetical protein